MEDSKPGTCALAGQAEVHKEPGPETLNLKGLGLGFKDLGFGVWGLESGAWCLGFRVGD